jgi:AraC-like DNA-binding protein
LPSSDAAPAMLLAVDEDQRIHGADRVARATFALDDKTLAAGKPLSSLFDYSFALFRRRGGLDVPVLLARPGGADHWRALLTPPLSKSNLSRNSPEAVIHAQPRLSMLSYMPVPEVPDANRGGLSPALKNRVCDFIESHISEKISLDALSSMAGLSPHHFARAFQQSLGVPPHRYLLRRRLEHVEQMLRHTQLPLSHIALAVGFSDQSHLNRHFRRLTGMSPSLARGLER